MSNPTTARIYASFLAGSPTAADTLFYRYIDRLSRLARTRLAPRLARRVDPEDVVMSAFRSFFVAARADRFTIQESGDLWALLAQITLRKVYRTAEFHTAEKRSTQRETEVSAESDLTPWLTDRQPTPDEAVAMSDELEWLLNSLNAEHRRIIELRLQGEQLADIAEDLGISERTVRRALSQIVADTKTRNGISSSSINVDPPGVAIAKQRPATCVVDAFTDVAHSAQLISFGDIRLERLIGRGGMGKVYEARFVNSKATLAVKFLHKSLQKNPHAVQTMLDEAATIQQLKHRGIVRLHGIGRTESGVLFIAMHLVAGRSIDRLTDPIEVPPIVDWIAGIADALQYLHDADIAHCDLKPSNVIIDKDGQPVLTDFGLARSIIQPIATDQRLAGTAPWMAPEQIDSHFGAINAVTDVYALGALLYTLLCGQPPFTGTRTADILASVISDEVVSPSEHRAHLPPALVSICLKCLSRKQTDRPKNARFVASALKSLRDS